MSNILWKSALVENLQEYFNSFWLFCIFVDLNGAYVFILIVLIELYLSCEILEKFILVAIFAQIDIFELAKAVFAVPW